MTIRRAPLAAVLVLLLVGACGSGGTEQDDSPSPSTSSAAASSAPAPGASTPEQAVSLVMAAIEAGDCDAAKAVVVTPDALDCGSVATLRGGYADAGVDLDDVSLAGGEPSGDSATVVADLGEGSDPETWQVERVDGSWKVLFDSEE